ncbi:MAG: hypothetical protein NXI30_08395 [bacterium]|nr:hypothetical protein [bacterium]
MNVSITRSRTAGIGRSVRRHFDRRQVMREASRANSPRQQEVGTMKAIQKIETGICMTIGALLATGWVLAIGELFAHTV